MKKTITNLNRTKNMIGKGLETLMEIRRKAKKNNNSPFQKMFKEKEWFLGQFKEAILDDPNKKEYSVTKKYETLWSKDDEEFVEMLEQYFSENHYLADIKFDHTFGETWDDENPFDYLTVTIRFEEGN